MKQTSMIKALMLALPVSLLTAADTSLLLIENARTTVGEAVSGTGGAKAIIKTKGGETRVTADLITFHESKNSLVCVGESTVASGERIVKGKDITIEFGGSSFRVFVLRSDRTLLLNEKPGFESHPMDTHLVPSFNERLPSTNLDLKKRTRR